MTVTDVEAFFTRGIPDDLDLMAFPCTEDHRYLFHGAVAKIIAFAREGLAGCSGEDVRGTLQLAEFALFDMVQKDVLVDRDGRPFSMGEVRKRSAIEFLPPTCMRLSAAYDRMVERADEYGGVSLIRESTATPAHICLALALGHAVTAISRMDTPGFFQIGAWHAMVAAEVMGVFYLQANDINYKSYLVSQGARNSVRNRWARLDPVKALAFRRRQEYPHLSRSRAIDQMLPEVLDAAKDAGEPLTGGDPKATVEGWFRKAGVK
ncbi:hypothetical protein [Dyella japonica]|uniref:Uncharacterized protein n=1 Tax=Dyella japonica DSM 16301 TaxID=1440762 RepID=A0A0G9H408_9GAMM|nr:hypothetical protein [Dyella japonica]KLD64580.1 hypothetical protein Y882_06850 [Dyella japonica DSM 16301]